MNLKTSLIALFTAVAVLIPATFASGQQNPYYYPVTPYPIAKIKPTLSLKVAPKRDKKKPFKFVAAGKLGRKSAPKSACSGKVKIIARRNGKVVARKNPSIKRSNCTYRATIKAKVGKSKRGKIRVAARFRGNTRLKPVSAKAKTVNYGKKKKNKNKK